MFFWKKYFNKKERIVLSILLVIGLLLRVVNAFATQLWRDEVYIFFTSQNSVINLLLQRHWDTAHPSLYFIFLHFWQKINITPIFLRLPSLIISIFILYSIPVIAKKLNPKNAIFPYLALFFYSFSHAQISLNMVARPYPFVILFMLISIVVFLEFLKRKADKIGKKEIILFVLANFFIFFSDYSGIWLLFSYSIFFIFYFLMFHDESSRKKTIFKGLLLSLLFCSILLPILIINLSTSLGLETQLIAQFNTGSLLTPIFEHITFFSGATSVNLSIVIFLISLLGGAKLLIDNKKSGLFLLSILICPIILSYIFSLLVKPIFMGRNLLLVNIAVIFGLSYFLSLLSKSKYLIWILIFTLIIYSINFFRHFPYLHFTDPPYDWDGIAKTMTLDDPKKIYVVTESPKYMFSPLQYYLLLNSKSSEIILLGDKIYPKTIKNNLYVLNFEDFSEKGNFFKEWELRFKCKAKNYNFNYLYFAKCI
jgi:hypothetical protein